MGDTEDIDRKVSNDIKRKVQCEAIKQTYLARGRDSLPDSFLIYSRDDELVYYFVENNRCHYRALVHDSILGTIDWVTYLNTFCHYLVNGSIVFVYGVLHPSHESFIGSKRV